ncbi:hypothetical protein STEG23_021709, partial [Scotinomys teguina]
TDPQPSSTDVSPLSPALLGVVWTFLSCGLLLVLFFLAFTIRCRNNRIVKMSSPNLNIVTLLGSCLTYSSAYLFGIQDAFVRNSMEALIQTRLSMLCIGTSLVFGPILGKSWRLYKVFTQRVPDKRVDRGTDLYMFSIEKLTFQQHFSPEPIKKIDQLAHGIITRNADTVLEKELSVLHLDP